MILSQSSWVTCRFSYMSEKFHSHLPSLFVALHKISEMQPGVRFLYGCHVHISADQCVLNDEKSEGDWFLLCSECQHWQREVSLDYVKGSVREFLHYWKSNRKKSEGREKMLSSVSLSLCFLFGAIKCVLRLIYMCVLGRDLLCFPTTVSGW